MTASVRELRLPAPAVQMPTSLAAEQALLGAVLYDSRAFANAPGAKAEHFSEPFHGRLWALMAEMIGRGEIPDPITVSERLASDPGLADLGGLQYLGRLIADAPPPENARGLASAVYDTAMRRDLVMVCQEGLRQALSETQKPAFEIVSEMRRIIEGVETASAPEDATMAYAPEAARAAIKAMSDLSQNGRVRGKMTGLRCIDRRLGGLRAGMLVVIGGRPGMAKTGLLRAIMHGAAVRDPQGLYPIFGIEMGPEEMMQRELSALTHEAGEGVEYQSMAKGRLTPFDLQVIASAEGRVPPNLVLDDCPALSVDDVRRKVWGLKRKGRVPAIGIDYLQIMTRPEARGRNEASVLGEMTKGLKQLARQAETCVILLSQLSRAVEARDDKRPQLSDLRESGSIEQDADAVLFPFREVYYLERNEPKQGGDAHEQWRMRCGELHRHLDVICAKQRQGPVGTDRQRYFAEFDFIEDEPQ